jgi:hypothetical protein
MKAVLMQFIGSANWYRCRLNRNVMETMRNRHGAIAALGLWGSIVLCAMLALPCAADAQPVPSGSPAPPSPVAGDAQPPAQPGGSDQISAAPHLTAPGTNTITHTYRRGGALSTDLAALDLPDVER